MISTLFRGDLVHAPRLDTFQILHDHVLAVDDNGMVDYVGQADSPQSIALLDHPYPLVTIPRGSFLIPTFCDLHLHAPQFLYQGTGLHLPLMEWLNEYAFKAEEKMDADEQLAERVYTRLAERLIEHGTGTVLLFGTIKVETNLILARCMLKAGVRAFVGKLSMDQSSTPTYMESSSEAALTAAASFVNQCSNLEVHVHPEKRLIQPVLTPRFVPTCSDELLRGLAELSARQDLRVQSHMAEAHDQVAWVRAQRGMEDIDVFDKHGLLTPRTVQAHCTYLDPASLQRVADSETAVAHCPLSNAYFSNEPFRLREALERKVLVGLGTDIAGGYDISIMSAMRHAVTVSRMREGARLTDLAASSTEHPSEETSREKLSVDWKEALYLATRGGAQALGSKSGAFEPGAPFDAQHITLVNHETGVGIGALDFLDNEGVEMCAGSGKLPPVAVEKWFCLGDVRNRVDVWIQGRKVSPEM